MSVPLQQKMHIIGQKTTKRHDNLKAVSLSHLFKGYSDNILNQKSGFCDVKSSIVAHCCRKITNWLNEWKTKQAIKILVIQSAD